MLEWFPDADDDWLRAVRAAVAGAEIEFRTAKAQQKWDAWTDDKIEFDAPPPAWKAGALYVRTVLAAHIAQANQRGESPEHLEEFLTSSRNNMAGKIFDEKVAPAAAASVNVGDSTRLVFQLYVREGLRSWLETAILDAWRTYSANLKASRDQGGGAHPAHEPRRRGPRPDMERHTRVYEVVRQEAGENWVRTWKDEENLSKITDALDEGKVPVPRPWKDRTPALGTWADALEKDKDNLIKSLTYSISEAREKQ